MSSASLSVPPAFAEIAAELPALSTPADLTRVLGIPKNTQNDWRSKGRGPKFMKIGRTVYYTRDDVLAYLRNSVYSSVSEAKAANK